jgi:hypothetical protein
MIKILHNTTLYEPKSDKTHLHKPSYIPKTTPTHLPKPPNVTSQSSSSILKYPPISAWCSTTIALGSNFLQSCVLLAATPKPRGTSDMENTTTPSPGAIFSVIRPAPFVSDQDPDRFRPSTVQIVDAKDKPQPPASPTNTTVSTYDRRATGKRYSQLSLSLVRFCSKFLCRRWVRLGERGK